MVDPFSHIEESFKNAFEHWEAPHSTSEMNAGWNQVANHLPTVPHAPTPGHAAGHIAGGAGKIIGFTGIGAAVVTTAAVLYNIYVKPVKPALIENGKSIAKTEQLKPAPGPATSQNKNNISLAANPAKRMDGPGKSNNEVSMGQSGQPESSNLNPIAANPFFPTVPNGPESPVKQNAASNNGSSLVTQKPQSSIDQVQSMKLFLSDTVVCVGVQVAASSNVSYPGVVIEWGDGQWNDFYGKNVHTYLHPGQFRAHLTIDSIRADRYITVLTTPKAKFMASQGEKLNCLFNNLSANANNYDWNYGDGSPDEPGFYPSHAYDDTGRYEVRLVAIASSGCTDTAVQYINVQQFSDPVPTSNVITPNGDGLNDDVGVNIEGETSFEFTVMDATGQKVFQTTDKNKRWGGQNQFTGADCKPGPYYYTITYSFSQNSAPKTKRGNLTLIRSKN